MIKKDFLQLININKTYSDGFTACNNVNISIDRGEFVTILGPSGCGKTTLLKMIAGFEMPTFGKILVNNIDIKDLSISQRPTATVFQDYALFPNMNVFENISYGLKVMRKKREKLPKKLQEEALKVEEDCEKKARSEIKKIQKDKNDIKNDLEKIDREYQKKPELYAIKDMRKSQLDSHLYNYEKQLKKKKGPDYTFEVSPKNKRKLRQFLSPLFFWKKDINLETKGLDPIEINALNLIKNCYLKSSLDKKVDKLRYKYNDLDQWVSYWENYPLVQKEAFEKKNTTRTLTKKEIFKKATEVIQLVGLEGNEKKYPTDLSGGMQQRVALARAIVVEPQILLLDEPLSALDAKVRRQMQVELKRIHNELGITFILVTHDQEEALSLSNKIVVMSKGKVEQIGTVKSIYEHPKNEWVANFIGKANLIEATYIDGDKFTIGEDKYEQSSLNLKAKIKPGSNFKLLLRPEDLEICPLEKAFVKLKVTSVLYKGMMFEVVAISKNRQIFKIETIKQIKVNEILGISWDFKYAHVISIEKAKKDTPTWEV